MHSLGLWIFQIFLAISFSPFCNGIQCYLCTSVTHTLCRDAYFYNSENDQPIDCTQNLVDNTLVRIKQDLTSPGEEAGNYDCIKVEVRVAYNQTAIVRGCAQAQTKRFDPCVDIRRQFTNQGDISHCSVCKYDACNHSYTFHAYSLLTLLIPTLLIIVRH